VTRTVFDQLPAASVPRDSALGFSLICSIFGKVGQFSKNRTQCCNITGVNDAEMSCCVLLKGVFVSFVHANSPAALVGLRFGDQILQINGENVAGWDTDKVFKVLRKAAPERITMAIRDRLILVSY